VEATVTDANVVLGRIDPGNFLGGEMRLDAEAARRAVEEKIARPLGLGVEEAADGIVRVINATMVRGMRAVSVEKGYDPRDFAIVAFGGGGPLHAADLAREMGVPSVLIPVMPGVTSALGLLVADLRYDVSATVRGSLAAPDLSALTRVYEDLERQAIEQMARDGVEHGVVQLTRTADVRYGRQSWELEVEVPVGIIDEAALAVVAAEFHEAHRQAYGYAMDDEELILVNAQVSAIAALPKPPLGRATGGNGHGPAMAHDQAGERRTWLGGRWVTASVYERRGLPPGAAIEGPAIVEQLDTTTFLGLGDRARVDEYGNLVVEVAR
jgi:N-methylhydantoinase A